MIVSHDAGSAKHQPSRVQVCLAVLLAMTVYVTLWYVGVVFGFVFSPLGAMLVAALIFARTRLKQPGLRQIAGDVAASVGTGFLLKPLTQMGMGTFTLTLFIPAIAGVAVGIIRRDRFVPFFSSNLRKIAFGTVFGCGVAAVSMLGIDLAHSALDVPDRAIAPSKLAEGWSAVADPFDALRLLQARRKYEKGISGFQVWAELVPQDSRSQEEYRNQAEMLISAARSMGPAPMSAILEKEEVLYVDRNPRYMFRYGIQSESVSVKAWVFYFWRCAALPTEIAAYAMIRDEPIDDLLDEVNEMVISIACP